MQSAKSHALFYSFLVEKWCLQFAPINAPPERKISHLKFFIMENGFDGPKKDNFTLNIHEFDNPYYFLLENLSFTSFQWNFQIILLV